MSESAHIFDRENNTEMNKPHFEINRISDGLQFGYGTISGLEESPEILGRADEVIHGSDNILVPVDRDDAGHFIEDDGCGDGREVARTFTQDRTFKRSLNRSKVFGGAAAMTAASLIGVGAASGKSLDSVFESAISTLNKREIDFGAHTDELASGDNCGCGAIDRSPEAILAALKYEQPIRDVLAGLDVDISELDAVYGNFRAYVGEMPNQVPFGGGNGVMDKIRGSGKVIKQLGGEHRERRIILNTVREHTINQELVRRETDGRAQAFAVDIWRLGDIAQRLFPDNPERQSQALLSELVYTLSIAAVLTKGDLPVDMVQEAPTPVTA